MRTLLATTALLVACSDYEFTGKDLVDEPREDTAVPEVPTEPDPTWPVTDTFEVAQKTDVLVYGDTSGSMEIELQTMADNVTVFVDRLAENLVDWQLIAVTGPDGCAQGGVLSPAVPDYAARFAAGIVTVPGEDLVDEWGLNNSAVALEQNGPGQCNEGFVRDDALVHVIIISDEDDNSPGFDEASDYWLPYVARMQAAVSDPWRLHISYVGGAVPDGCDGAEPGYGYWEATAYTEGEFVSICDAWAEQIQVLADVSTVESVFELSSDPMAGSVTVEVNGRPREDGWHVAWEPPSVVFDENAPASGDVVRVHYEVEAP